MLSTAHRRDPAHFPCAEVSNRVAYTSLRVANGLLTLKHGEEFGRTVALAQQERGVS